jgi:hypothetical protein
MNPIVKTTLAVAAAIASMAASAQPWGRIDTREIDARQAKQQQRIERGAARGDFTRSELRTLQIGQREIARVESRAKADGRVTPHERRTLTAMLDRADTQIRNFRHDRDGRRHG